MGRTGQSFKAVLNPAVKRALGRRQAEVRVEPLFPAPFPAELAQQSFNRPAADWEDEETAQRPIFKCRSAKFRYCSQSYAIMACGPVRMW